MVSFSCEQCNDTIKKPKLDQHAGRCRGAYFTCIDCNTTFEGTSYRAHTSCVSEEQRYHKSVYKAPKGKGKKGQQQQQQPAAQGVNGTPAQAVAPEPAAAPAPTPAAAEDKKSDSQSSDPKKRAREDDEAPKAGSSQVVTETAPVLPSTAPAAKDEEQPAKKKNKKSKKSKGDANGERVAASAGEQAVEAPSVKAFLTETVTPLLAGDNVSLAEVRKRVVEQATSKGLKVDEVESALWAGLKVGGKKQKVRAEFA